MKLRFPLESIFKRGAIFLDPLYSKLDDPTFQDATKAKYFVVLNTSPSDDPIVYLLTTSEKPKHAGLSYMYSIPGGKYECFPKTTLIDVALAGTAEIGSDEFASVYEAGRIYYKGQLSEEHVAGLISAILECPVVDRRFKKTLVPPA